MLKQMSNINQKIKTAKEFAKSVRWARKKNSWIGRKYLYKFE